MKWLDLRIGGQKWGIYLVGPRSKWLRDDDGDYCKGLAHLDDCRIYVTNEASAEARDELLLHELLHAVLQVSGGSHAIGSKTKEELLVRDVTPLLHRLLVDLGFRFPKGTAS